MVVGLGGEVVGISLLTEAKQKGTVHRSMPQVLSNYFRQYSKEILIGNFFFWGGGGGFKFWWNQK